MIYTHLSARLCVCVRLYAALPASLPSHSCSAAPPPLLHLLLHLFSFSLSVLYKSILYLPLYVRDICFLFLLRFICISISTRSFQHFCCFCHNPLASRAVAATPTSLLDAAVNVLSCFLHVVLFRSFRLANFVSRLLWFWFCGRFSLFLSVFVCPHSNCSPHVNECRLFALSLLSLSLLWPYSRDSHWAWLESVAA